MKRSTRIKTIVAVTVLAGLAATGVVVAQSSGPDPSDALRNVAENPNGLARSISPQQRQELDGMIRPPITTNGGALSTPAEHAALQAAVDADIAAQGPDPVAAYENPRAYSWNVPDNPGELTYGGAYEYDVTLTPHKIRYVRVSTTIANPTIRISYTECTGEIGGEGRAACDLYAATWTYVPIPAPNTNLEIDPITDGGTPEVTLRDRTTKQALWVFNMGNLTVRPVNRPPVCTAATASPNRLWPANHQLNTVTIGGVSDPDGDPTTVNVTAVSQDEPVNGTGDGDTSPDAILGTGANLQVRAERSGSGDGRVYRITFQAADGKGGTCNTTVTVGVPHSNNGTPIDSGGNYNSLLP